MRRSRETQASNQVSPEAKLTSYSIEGFAGDNTLSDRTTDAWGGNKMATAQSTNTTGTIAWNNAFVPLTLIIPTFTLPTASTVEAGTVSDLPAPTQLGHTRPAEASGNVAYSATIRGLGLWYLLLLIAMIICESL
ncbi:hypothetical protein N7494_005301 [Penicillium frequentans]|uniref:Uncharacterized protein n=1 Tax=Penicillium frequentans TaxID=3151616 RepID=A0AAD6GHA9_9EURO|nr:hypothetical protein N7494_005301 [Penicillium glabrum]